MALIAVPMVGETYTVFSSRKGKFKARVLRINDEFADLEVVSGIANAMLPENRAGKGEEVTVRISFCTFTKEGE